MTKFMVDGLHPHAFALVNPAAFPIFGMNQMDTAILKGSASSSTGIEILEPLNLWSLHSIKAAEV
jgi:hypothetical protein